MTDVKELLREDSLSEVPLIKIAFSLGFRGHSSFTATFKNYTDCTPSEYREKDNLSDF